MKGERIDRTVRKRHLWLPWNAYQAFRDKIDIKINNNNNNLSLETVEYKFWTDTGTRSKLQIVGKQKKTKKNHHTRRQEVNLLSVTSKTDRQTQSDFGMEIFYAYTFLDIRAMQRKLPKLFEKLK